MLKFQNDYTTLFATFEDFILLAINEQIQNIAQKKDTLCRMMYN